MPSGYIPIFFFLACAILFPIAALLIAGLIRCRGGGGLSRDPVCRLHLGIQKRRFGVGVMSEAQHGSRDFDRSLVTTAFTLDGYRIAKNYGIVRGIIVRSRSVFGTIGA